MICFYVDMKLYNICKCGRCELVLEEFPRHRDRNRCFVCKAQATDERAGGAGRKG